MIANSTAGEVIQGLEQAGRWPALYVLVMTDDTAYLILAYSKTDQTDLTEKQRKAVAQLAKQLKDG